MSTHRQTFIHGLLIAVGLVCATGAHASAATRVWTGLGGNTLLSTPGNWENNTPPDNGDSLIFPETAPNVVLTNDIVGLYVFKITIRKRYFFNGNPFELASGGLVVEGGVPDGGFTANINLAASQQWTFGDSVHMGFASLINLGGHTLTVNSQGAASTQTFQNVVSGSGSIVKIGTGELMLSGNNSYTGQTTISDGTVVATNPFSFGFTDGTIASGTIVEQTGAIRVLGVGIWEALWFSGSNSATVPQTMLSCQVLCEIAGPVTVTGPTRLGRAVVVPGNPPMAFLQPFKGNGHVTFLHTGPVVLESHGSVLPGGVTVARAGFRTRR